MPRTQTVGTLSEVTTDATLEDGRVRIHAGDDDATVYLRRPEAAPLEEGQTAGWLVVAGEGIDIEVGLDGADVDALTDALHHLQEQLRAEVA